MGRSDGDGTGGPMGAPDAAAPFGLGGPAGPTGVSVADLALADIALAERLLSGAQPPRSDRGRYRTRNDEKGPRHGRDRAGRRARDAAGGGT